MGKKINECASAIIDGLGYEIISDSEGIVGFQHKESQDVFRRTDGNIQSDAFKLKDGLRVQIAKSGSAIIEYPKDELSIFICNEEGQKETIVLSYTADSKRRRIISFNYEPSNGNNRYNINLMSGINEETLEYIYTSDELDENGELKWHSYNGNNYETIQHEASDLTSEKINGLFIDCLSKHNDGKDWTDNLQKGLRIITPAIDQIFTPRFKNSWVQETNAIIIENTKANRDDRNLIEAASARIEKRNLYNLAARHIGDIFSDGSEIKKLYEKKPGETDN